MEEPNAMLEDLAERVSEDSSVSNDDNIVSNNQTAHDHEKFNPMEPNSGAQDTTQGFKVYSGDGGGYNPMGSNPGNDGTGRQSTTPGTVQSWPEAAATWTSTVTVGMGTAMAMATVKPTGPSRDVWASTARTALATPREVGDCGRKHKRDTTDWGPGQGWNISTLPAYRCPSSPCNRLFSGIKETRPGRNPEALLERLVYTPQPTPPRNTSAHLRPSLERWNSSVSLSAPPTPRRKPHSSTETSSVENGTFPGKRQQQQQNVEHASTPSKNAGSAGDRSNGRQQPGSKLSKVMKEWKFSTRPQWKNTVKWNQFENIKEIRRPPRVHNNFTGVKAQYMKPSKKYLRLKKERDLEAQRRKDLRELDMKYY